MDYRCETPVVFLIFNRPDTTRRVLEAIRAAKPSTLLVVADGPRPNVAADAERCAETRALLDSVDWECDVRRNYADANLGCGRRISSGLTWAFEQVESAIILEDDCVPAPDFFPFCEALLHYYRNDERIMLISGSNMVDNVTIGESYLFSRWYNIWGWATWRRAWQLYDYAMTDWPSVRQTGTVEYSYPVKYVSRYLRHNFDLAHSQAIDTWDISWFYTCLSQNALCIVPRVNLISNIGVTGTHTHGGHGGPRPTSALNAQQLQHPKWMRVHSGYDHAFYVERLKPTLSRLLNHYATALGMRLTRFRTKYWQGNPG